MKIIRNSQVITAVTDNLLKAELSNLTLLTQQTPILGDYFSIDPNMTEVVEGFKTVEEFIGSESRVQYNKIENMPIYFGSEFTSQLDYDGNEMGVTVSFNVNGAVLPNTIKPKANEFFVPYGSKVPLLLRVTNYEYNDFKENPFINVSFDLASRDATKIAQLRKQVITDNRFILSSIGTDRVSIITKASYEKLLLGTQDYLAIMELYTSLFFNKSASLYTFKSLEAIEYEDRVFMNFLMDKKIFHCDPILAFAKSNTEFNGESVFLAYDVLQSRFKNTPFDFIMAKKTGRFNKKIEDVTLFPAEFQYKYDDIKNHNLFCKKNRQLIYWYEKEKTTLDPFLFTKEFMDAITANTLDKYPVDSLEQAMVLIHNNGEVNFDTVSIDDEPSIRNFYLIPLLLLAYREKLETYR